MGPLQYMVVGYKSAHFNEEILPELQSLSHKGVIRVMDVLFVAKDAEGIVTSQEFSEVMPEQYKLIDNSADKKPEWFAQDDIDVVGETLPKASTVALLLFEHRWAARLDEAVGRANGTLAEQGTAPGNVASEIEHLLTLGAAA